MLDPPRFAWHMLDISDFSQVQGNCRFAEAVLKAHKGERGIIQPSFVYLPGIPGGKVVQDLLGGLDYFSTNIELGVNLH